MIDSWWTRGTNVNIHTTPQFDSVTPHNSTYPARSIQSSKSVSHSVSPVSKWSSPPTMSSRTTFKDLTPLKTFAKASKSCAAQVRFLDSGRSSRRVGWLTWIEWDGSDGSHDLSWVQADIQSLAYGQCVGKSYKEVQKGMCEAEFKAFKECVQVSKHIHSFILLHSIMEKVSNDRNHSDGNGNSIAPHAPR